MTSAVSFLGVWGSYAPVPGLGNLNSGLYRDFTKGSLSGGTGPTFTLTRATATTGLDLNGLVTTVASGDPRWWRLGAGSGAVGLSVFGASTERLLWNRDFTNAAWVKGATATVAKDQTGADGVANSASRLTGGAVTSTNTVGQGVVLASSTRYQYAYIKRLSGAGTIEMSGDAGLSFVDVTAQVNSSTYTLVTIPAQTIANPGAVFRVPNGNAIAVDFASNRSEGIAPVITTTTAQVAVNADVVTAADGGIISATEGTFWVQAVGSTDAVSLGTLFAGSDGSSVNRALIRGISGFAVVTSNTVTSANINFGALVSGSANKLALRVKLNDFAISKNGAAPVADVTGAVPLAMNRFDIGNTFAATEGANTVIQAVAYSRIGATDANLALATA